MISISELIARVEAIDPGAVENEMPNDERLSRGEACAELGLDPGEFFRYAAFIYDESIAQHGREHVAAADLLLAGLKLGLVLRPD